MNPVVHSVATAPPVPAQVTGTTHFPVQRHCLCHTRFGAVSERSGLAAAASLDTQCTCCRSVSRALCFYDLCFSSWVFRSCACVLRQEVQRMVQRERELLPLTFRSYPFPVPALRPSSSARPSLRPSQPLQPPIHRATLLNLSILLHPTCPPTPSLYLYQILRQPRCLVPSKACLTAILLTRRAGQRGSGGSWRFPRETSP